MKADSLQADYSDYGFKLKSLQTSGIAHLHEPANRIHNLR